MAASSEKGGVRKVASHPEVNVKQLLEVIGKVGLEAAAEGVGTTTTTLTAMITRGTAKRGNVVRAEVLWWNLFEPDRRPKDLREMLVRLYATVGSDRFVACGVGGTNKFSCYNWLGARSKNVNAARVAPYFKLAIAEGIVTEAEADKLQGRKANLSLARGEAGDRITELEERIASLEGIVKRMNVRQSALLAELGCSVGVRVDMEAKETA